MLELDYPPNTDLGRQCPACCSVAMDLRLDCGERSAELGTLGNEADLTLKTYGSLQQCQVVAITCAPCG